MPKTHTVKVNVPTRPDFHGYYSAQRHLQPGKATLEGLTSQQLKELQADDEAGRVTIMDIQSQGEDEAPGKADEALKALSPEEQAAVMAVRAQKAAQGNSSAASAPLTPVGPNANAPNHPDSDDDKDHGKGKGKGR